MIYLCSNDHPTAEEMVELENDELDLIIHALKNTSVKNPVYKWAGKVTEAGKMLRGAIAKLELAKPEVEPEPENVIGDNPNLGAIE